MDLTLKTKEPYWVPTNVSYVVPSHYLVKFLEGAAHDPAMRPDPSAKTIDQMLQEGELVNIFERGRNWVRKQVDPGAEAERVRNSERVPPRPDDRQNDS